MTRPTFPEVFMDLAVNLARRSTCSRAKVGCVITSIDHHQVFAIGYNGSAAGLENGCDSATVGGCGCLHAEENACIHCDAPRGEPKRVYTTMLPCKMCAKRLINLGGVVEVIYLHDYRLRESIAMFRRVGIRIVPLIQPTNEEVDPNDVKDDSNA